jgi:hypothetical protein
MRDKDQKSLEELYENRILSEISSEYYNSPDNSNKRNKKKYRKLESLGEINPPDKSAPEYTRGLKPVPQISGPFETPERIDLEQIEDPQEIREYKNSINNLRGQIIAFAQDPEIPNNSKHKLETLLENRNLCMEIVNDLVLGFGSDDKYVKLMHPKFSTRDYPNGDPVFNIVQDGKNKLILVLGIKSKFVSGVSEYSDIKYKFV